MKNVGGQLFVVNCPRQNEGEKIFEISRIFLLDF